jgi:Clp amino terminal domain, pathogenicity island component
MNDQSPGQAELPRSPYLDHSLRRARSAAEQRSHRYVTLEHLLFALLDDPDAARLLSAAGADVALIHATVADTINHRMAALIVPAAGQPPGFSYKFASLLQNASEEALKAGHREIDGAFALIAIARDPESNAAAILAENGFSWRAALELLAQVPAGTHQAAAFMQSPPAVKPGGPRLSGAEFEDRAGMAGPEGGTIREDMLASVRNILEAEERKERGLPPFLPPGRQASRPGAPRQEPQPPFLAEPPAAPYGHEERPGAPIAERAAAGRNAGGTASRKDRTASANSASLLQDVPRNARIGSPETVRVRMTKEETSQLLSKARRRSPPQHGTGAHILCCAVAMHLAAPEGGFFVEALSPETQWLPAAREAVEKEPFGDWAWTLMPADTGYYPLSLSVSARELDSNGNWAHVRLPVQTFKARIRGSLFRFAAGLFKTMLLLLLGSGLTVGAWYAFNLLSKLRP